MTVKTQNVISMSKQFEGQPSHNSSPISPVAISVFSMNPEIIVPRSNAPETLLFVLGGLSRPERYYAQDKTNPTDGAAADIVERALG